MQKLLFCHRCLTPIVENGKSIWYDQRLEGTVLIVDDKEVTAPMRGNSLDIEGNHFQGLFFECPKKHLVIIEPTKEQQAEWKRLLFNHGKPCLHRPDLRKKPACTEYIEHCEDCQVVKNAAYHQKMAVN